MTAKKDIRSLTYSALAIQTEFSCNKWKPNNDEVFNKLGEMVQEQEQILIADFLNLFYYFIICYSKKCFKKHGLWQSSRTNKLLSHKIIKFNYELANENDTHGKLLEIQQRMNQFRQEYKNAVDNCKLYHTNDKKREMVLFIEESINLICTDIQEPVILTSYDIKAKIAKYTKDSSEKQKRKKSTKLNYAVLDTLGLDMPMPF
jgi:hypothetical protein